MHKDWHLIPQPGSRALILRPGRLSLGTVEPPTDRPVLRVVEYVDSSPFFTGGRAIFLLPLADLAAETASGQAVPDRPANAGLAVFDEALRPYAFGNQRYDPFESLEASLDQATRSGSPLVMALWAAMESDLFRFAYDGGFTSDLELVRDGAEWRRFARLNDLYRAIIRAIVPFGLVPPSWNSWLRDPSRPASRHTRIAALGTRILTRNIGAVHGVILARAEPGSIFLHR